MIVGVDLGTQSLKAVACDAQLRAVRAATRPVGDRDPRAWERALGEAVRALGATAVDALAITGQLDGCVPVDRAGDPLGDALIWQDRPADAPVGDRARVWAIAAQVADPSHLAPKIALRRGAARYHTPTTFLTARLCGRAVIDPALASTTMLYDLAARAWSPELLAMFGVDAAALPELAAAEAIAGGLDARGAALTGLPAGTPVVVGTGDDFANVLGAGVSEPGRAIVTLGTAEVVGALADALVRDPHGPGDPLVETHAFPRGDRYFVENPGWLAGGAVKWAMRLLGVADEAEFDALAASVPLGASGVTFVPALAGAMAPVWRPNAAGALHGLRAHHDRAHVARAVLEGLACASRDVVDRLAAMGLPSREVVVVGGGARSATWLQLRADLLGLPHVALAVTDAAPLGAARLVASDAPAPAVVARYAPACDPDHRDRAYRRYRALVEPLSATLPGA